MNVKLNKLLGEMPFVKDFFVCGSSSDESLSIGACYFLSRIKKLSNKPLPTLYLGPGIDSATVHQELLKSGQAKKYKIIKNVSSKKIAQLLADGHVVARASGRTEFGARALGNRSILANPSRPDVVKQINEMIKGRDFWMPFALTVLDRYESRYLRNPKKYESNYMATCMDVHLNRKEEVRGGIHPYDHTVRPQILRREHNPEYHAIISEFAKITGIGAILNTSFNLHGYPMVNSVREALFVFKNSGLTHLVIGQTLIQKR